MLSYYGTQSEVAGNFESIQPFSRIDASKEAVEDLLAMPDSVLGYSEVNGSDLRCCRHTISKIVYCGKEQVTSEVEDEVVGGYAVCLGVEAVGHKMQILTGQDQAFVESNIVELREGVSRMDRRYAALRLGKKGPLARRALPVLQLALQDEGWTVRRMACMALARVAPQDDSSVLESLGQIAKTDPRSEVISMAVWAIEQLTSPSRLPVVIYL